MMMKQIFIASLLLFALLLSSSLVESATSTTPLNCDGKCKQRCGRAGYLDRCMKYCGICCVECKCVPSGTYGNKHECPCYRDKVNSKGKPKCP